MSRTAGSTGTVTRQRILDAAEDLFVRRGFSGTSMRDIAERLSMTKASLYYHFPSKEDLLDVLVTPSLRLVDDFLDTAEASREVTPAIARRLVVLLTGDTSALHPFFTDPSAQQAMATRHDIAAGQRRLQQVLAGSDDPRSLVRARCALGAINGALRMKTSATGNPCDQHSAPPGGLTDEEIDVVTESVIAILGTAVP